MFGISIHAPRTGSDGTISTGGKVVADFNPRSPHGERLNPRRNHARQQIYFNPRSPHGERRVAVPGAGSAVHFNPRSPHGERPRKLTMRGILTRISIHAPRTGSDQGLALTLCDGRISIHAPRTGSDCVVMMAVSQRISISIHAPRTGSDTGAGLPKSANRRFQSTLPARGATTNRYRKRYLRFIFQSTLPARGATRAHPAGRADRRYFNPRSPHGERRQTAALREHHRRISIHAPRTGSDPPAPASWTASPPFQSTLPARGATADPR